MKGESSKLLPFLCLKNVFSAFSASLREMLLFPPRFHQLAYFTRLRSSSPRLLYVQEARSRPVDAWFVIR